MRTVAWFFGTLSVVALGCDPAPSTRLHDGGSASDNQASRYEGAAFDAQSRDGRLADADVVGDSRIDAPLDAGAPLEASAPLDAGGPLDAASADAGAAVSSTCAPAVLAGAAVKSATPSNLATIVGGAKPGDVIALANGTYSKGLDVARSGTAAKPIVIRARNPGKATFTGPPINITGQHVVFGCFRVHDANITVGISKSYDASPGKGSRITRNWITNTKDVGNSAVIYVFYSSNVRVDHNDIGDAKNDFRRTGLHILNQPGGNSRIDHNYFHGSPGGHGEYEAIWIAGSHAWGIFDRTGIEVDHNLFDSWRGDNEVIATKTSGVTLHHNRFVNCRDLNLRVGEGNLVKNNVIEQRGIVIYGRDHLIIGNKLSAGAHIEVSGGSLNHAQTAAKAKGWEQSDSVVVYGNQGGTIIVGDPASSSLHPLPALDTKLGGNTSKVELRNHKGTVTPFAYTGDVGVAYGPSLAEVGPLAPGD